MKGALNKKMAAAIMETTPMSNKSHKPAHQDVFLEFTGHATWISIK